MEFKQLITWSEREFAHLPWRRQRNLYHTLLSEIMLQQTTVATVQNHFARFLKTYPTLESLAAAKEEDVLVAWSGLGYYRRAKNLRLIAKEISLSGQEKFPKRYEDWIQIKGVGPYTASAMMSIGLDQKFIAVDANLERVLARYYGIKELKGPKLQRKITELFEHRKILTPKEVGSASFRKLNEALMDLGRNFCQAGKASCELCPLRKKCIAFKEGNPLAYPYSSAEKNKLVKQEATLLRLIIKHKEKILSYQKSEEEWLGGQFELPTFLLGKLKKDDPLLKQYPCWPQKITPNLPRYPSTITKYKFENLVLKVSYTEFKKLVNSHSRYKFLASEDLVRLSSASKKALTKCPQ